MGTHRVLLPGKTTDRGVTVNNNRQFVDRADGLSGCNEEIF